MHKQIRSTDQAPRRLACTASQSQPPSPASHRDLHDMPPPAIHPAKRRRLDAHSAALARPFKSPLRVDVKSSAQEPVQALPKKQDETNPVADCATSLPPSPVHKSLPVPPLTRSSPVRKPPPPLSSSPTRLSSNDSGYAALQKQHSALTLRLSKLRQSLDTAQQALKIESSNQDPELELLIGKWKLASREAAEEIFRGARDRVNKMGGVGAWWDRTQQKPSGWGNEDEQIDESELTEEQKEELDFQRAEAKAELDKYGSAEPAQNSQPKDEESYTMDMMLKQLNIELDIIGYNKEAESWD